jgi:hypothetical protein
MTATISESDTDLDMTVLDALDFQPALVCEYGKHSGRTCDMEAVWVLRYKCCEEVILICHKHKEVVQRLAEKVFGHVEHVVCKKVMEIKSIDRI